MPLHLRRLILAALLFSMHLQANEHGQWQLATEKDDIRIELREEIGFPVKRFKATMTIKADIETVFKTITSVPDYPEWFADVSHTRLVKQISVDTNVAHVIIDSPWPVEDREVVFHRTVSGNQDEGYRLDFRAMDGYQIDTPCCIQIHRATGFFEVEKTDHSNETKITYEFVSDPSGDLPAWIVNYAITDSPMKSLSNLRSRLESN